LEIVVEDPLVNLAPREPCLPHCLVTKLLTKMFAFVIFKKASQCFQLRSILNEFMLEGCFLLPFALLLRRGSAIFLATIEEESADFFLLLNFVMLWGLDWTLLKFVLQRRILRGTGLRFLNEIERSLSIWGKKFCISFVLSRLQLQFWRVKMNRRDFFSFARCKTGWADFSFARCKAGWVD